MRCPFCRCAAQEQQLKQRRLEYLEAPGGSATSSLRTLLEAVADPNSSQGAAGAEEETVLVGERVVARLMSR